MAYQVRASHRYSWRTDELLHSETNEYKTVFCIGRGVFSTVLMCNRRSRGGVPVTKHRRVAIKIINFNEPRLGRMESHILSKVRETRGHLSNCVLMLEAFYHKNYFCIVCEFLGKSLESFLKSSAQIPVSGLKSITRDILTALNFLQQQGIIHTDLKPENIAMAGSEEVPHRVKVVDFGGAMLKSPHILDRRDFLQSMNYRSPEIFLRYRPFNEAIDMWSMGVILLKLFTYHHNLPYRMLHNGLCEYDLMRHMVEGQGMPPRELLNGGLATTKYFVTTKTRQIGWRLMTPEEYLQTPDFIRRTRVLNRDLVITEKPKLLQGFGSLALNEGMRSSTGLPLRTGLRQLYHMANLTNRMLELNPAKRITPSEALRHPFITS